MQNDFFHFFPDLKYDIPVSEIIARSPSSCRSRSLMVRDRLSLHPRGGDPASEYESQSDEQATAGYWDSMGFGLTTTDLPFPPWDQTASDLDYSSVAGREGTSCGSPLPFHEH